MNFNNQLKSIFLASMAIGACTASLCKNGEVQMGEESSIWRKRDRHPSCFVGSPGHGYRSDGVSACKGDHTSISLDMGKISDKRGCWLYSTQDTQGWTWDFQKGSVITFDAQWSGCEQVWSAPLWLTPATWANPQWSTGEIDLIENCADTGQGTFGTSIICREHPFQKGDGQCIDPQWGQANEGSGHFHGKIDAAGNWVMKKCDLNKSNCEVVSRYPRFLELNLGTRGGSKFHFVSDLYNGGDGDGGWKACAQAGRGINYSTNCKYTIANVVYSVGAADPADPSPDPTSSGTCGDFCAADRFSEQGREARHCGGNMAEFCGGCPYCVCSDFCAADRFSEPGREARHCGGNMYELCGGCSYCVSSNSARSEL